MRILIVKLSSIGDVVHALPAAAALRRALPEASISWAVQRRAGAILKDSPVIDHLIEIDSPDWRQQLLNGSNPSAAKGKTHVQDSNGDKRFDVAIDFQGLIKSG